MLNMASNDCIVNVDDYITRFITSDNASVIQPGARFFAVLSVSFELRALLLILSVWCPLIQMTEQWDCSVY